MQQGINGTFIVFVAGWAIAAASTTALVAQHVKWSNEHAMWQQQMAAQEARTTELEAIVAELHLALDEESSGLGDAAQQAGAKLSGWFRRAKQKLDARRETGPGAP